MALDKRGGGNVTYSEFLGAVRGPYVYLHNMYLCLSVQYMCHLIYVSVPMCACIYVWSILTALQISGRL